MRLLRIMTLLAAPGLLQAQSGPNQVPYLRLNGVTPPEYKMPF